MTNFDELNEDVQIALNELMGFWLIGKERFYTKEYLERARKYYKSVNIKWSVYTSFYNQCSGDYLGNMHRFVEFAAIKGYSLDEIKDMIRRAREKTHYNALKLC